MRPAGRIFLALICFATALGVAQASWYDDHDDGLKAAAAGNWSVVVDKMNRAIKGQPKESNAARTYGAIFINYHPYYYRGVANMNLGRYEQAISDLEKTSGPGPLDLGSIGELIRRAKSQAETSSVPPVVETPRQAPPPVIQPPAQQPAAPAIDNALRSRAQNAVGQARGRITAAQQRKATSSPQYTGALKHFTDANTRLATAKSNDDLSEVIALADNAVMLADSAAAPTTAAVVTPPNVTTTKPAAASDVVLADSSRRLRQALESYFAGEFDEASRGFQALARDLPNNGWIWAFLGASQYSQYAFEADEQYRDAAVSAFKKAKKLGRWKNGLPEKYFSRRIRKAFRETAG